MASRLRESPSPWAWVVGLLLATTLPMTASFILVRLGLNHWYQVTQPASPARPANPPPREDDTPAGTPMQVENVIPAGTPMQVTASQGLLLRAQPQPNSPVVGTAVHQQTIELLSTSPDQQWERVRLPAQEVVGWVKAGHLQPITSPAPSVQPNVWVTAQGGLILREAPSTDAPMITGLAYAQELILVTTNPDQTWAQVTIPATQTSGWVKSEFTRSTPPAEREGRQVQVNSPVGLILRQLPQGQPLTTLADREKLLVLDTSTDGQWLKVSVIRTEQEGWVNINYTQSL